MNIVSEISEFNYKIKLGKLSQMYSTTTSMANS